MASPLKHYRTFQIYIDVPYLHCNICSNVLAPSEFNPYNAAIPPHVTIERVVQDSHYPQFRIVGEVSDDELEARARAAGWLLELPNGEVCFCPDCQKKYGITGSQQ